MMSEWPEWDGKGAQRREAEGWEGEEWRKNEDKRETVDGDLQGLQRIDKWLAKWSLKPVDRPNHRPKGGRGFAVDGAV